MPLVASVPFHEIVTGSAFVTGPVLFRSVTVGAAVMAGATESKHSGPSVLSPDWRPMLSHASTLTVLPEPGVAALSGSPGSKSQASLNPATPLGGKLPPVSATEIPIVWSVWYHTPGVGPENVTTGRPASGRMRQLYPQASCSMLAEPQPVTASQPVPAQKPVPMSLLLHPDVMS